MTCLHEKGKYALMSTTWELYLEYAYTQFAPPEQVDAESRKAPMSPAAACSGGASHLRMAPNMSIIRVKSIIYLEDETVFDNNIICESASGVSGLSYLASFSIFEHESGGCVVQILRPNGNGEYYFGSILGIQELSLISQWISKAVGASIDQGGICSNSLPGWVNDQVTIHQDVPKQEPQEVNQSPPAPIMGWVYLIEGQEKCFKIGYTTNLKKRLWQQLSPRMPYPLKLIHSIKTDDCIELESRLHAIFDDKRLDGEWFKLDDADIDRFKDIGDHE